MRENRTSGTVPETPGDWGSYGEMPSSQVAMSEEQTNECPCCGSKKSLFGVLRPNDQDYSFDGKFYPLHIRKRTFWTLAAPAFRIKKGEKVWVCSDCGHLWSKVDLTHLKSVLKTADWDGRTQMEPPSEKPFTIWFFALIILALLCVIAWLHLIA